MGDAVGVGLVELEELCPGDVVTSELLVVGLESREGPVVGLVSREVPVVGLVSREVPVVGLVSRDPLAVGAVGAVGGDDGVEGAGLLVLEEVAGAVSRGCVRPVGAGQPAASSATVTGGREGLRVGVAARRVEVLGAPRVDGLVESLPDAVAVALSVAVALRVAVAERDAGGVVVVRRLGAEVCVFDDVSGAAPSSPGDVEAASSVPRPSGAGAVRVPAGGVVGRGVPWDVAPGSAVGAPGPPGPALGLAVGVRVGPGSTITVTAPSTSGGITTVMGADAVL